MEEAVSYGGAAAWLEVTDKRDKTEQGGILVIQEGDYIHREKRELVKKGKQVVIHGGRACFDQILALSKYIWKSK